MAFVVFNPFLTIPVYLAIGFTCFGQPTGAPTGAFIGEYIAFLVLYCAVGGWVIPMVFFAAACEGLERLWHINM